MLSVVSAHRTTRGINDEKAQEQVQHFACLVLNQDVEACCKHILVILL